MNHAFKLLLLSGLACAVACTVPTLEELEAESEKPYTCNAQHVCPEDSVCFENRCIRTTGLGCIPGKREPCGSDVGLCQKGTHLCGADGTFGACDNEVKPAFERCDGQDNDCDGETDYWSAIKLTQESATGSVLAAVPVVRASAGKPDTVLSVTQELGRLVTRTFTTDDGVVRPGETLSPPVQESSFLAPALAADGDRVALTWIERTPAAGAGGAMYKVLLAMLDGSGRRLTPPRALPIGSALPNVTELKVALNSTHVLVLMTTVGDFDPTSPMPVVEVWGITATRDLSTVYKPFKLATPVDGFGLHATANTTSDDFLVAYESGYVRYVAAVSKDGLVGTPTTLFRTSSTHSPYVVPNTTGFTVYYVQNSPDDTTVSDVKTRTCAAAGCGDALITSFAGAGKIERMQMVPHPGEQKPALALWVAKDEEKTPGQSYLYVADFATGSGALAHKLVSLYPSYGEVLVLMPDFSRYVLYQHDISSLAAGRSIAMSSESLLLPFCGP